MDEVISLNTFWLLHLFVRVHWTLLSFICRVKLSSAGCVGCYGPSAVHHYPEVSVEQMLFPCDIFPVFPQIHKEFFVFTRNKVSPLNMAFFSEAELRWFGLCHHYFWVSATLSLSLLFQSTEHLHGAPFVKQHVLLYKKSKFSQI